MFQMKEQDQTTARDISKTDKINIPDREFNDHNDNCTGEKNRGHQ